MEKLESYEFKLNYGNSRYDWDTLLDGGVYRLVRGTDFDVNPKSVRSAAIIAAKARGLKVRSSIEDDNTIVIQAYTPDADE